MNTCNMMIYHQAVHKNNSVSGRLAGWLKKVRLETFFSILQKMDNIFMEKKKRVEKKKIAAARLASILATRWTGNIIFFMNSLMEVFIMNGYMISKYIPPHPLPLQLVSSADHTLTITGTSGVAAAWGFHYYLTQYGGGHVSWAGSQVNLTSPLPVVPSPGQTVTSNDKYVYV